MSSRQPGGYAGNRRARHPDVRVGRSEPLSVRVHRCEKGRHARRGDRADRHRRADAGPRRGEEPRLYDHRHPRRGLFGDPRTDRRRRLHDTAIASPAGRRGVRPYGPIRSGDSRFFRRFGRRGRVPRRVDYRHDPESRCSVTEKIRTSRRRSTPGPAAPGRISWPGGN